MSRRLASLGLLVLLLVLHAQLWFGRGSVPSVNRMASELQTLLLRNAQDRLANERLAAEVRDLKDGLEIVEEKARWELGMVKPNEVFVQMAK